MVSGDGKKKLDTKSRIIETATRLFAEHGFDGVSLRDITKTAEVNLAAVNYHFGTKEELVRQVFITIAKPINTMRLAALDAYEREAGDGPLELERVVRALIEPAVYFTSDKVGGLYFTRLLVLARALPKPFINSVLAEEFDRIFHRFVAAFSRALPRLSYEDVAWRYDFSIGAMLHVVGYFDQSNRIKRVTNGVCDTDDVDRIIDELVAFIAAGLRAPGLPKFVPQPVEETAAVETNQGRMTSRKEAGD